MHHFDDTPQFSDALTVCSVCLVTEVSDYTQGYVGVCMPCTKTIDDAEERQLRPGCGCDFSFTIPRLCRSCGDEEDAAVDRAEARAVEREQARLEAL